MKRLKKIKPIEVEVKTSEVIAPVLKIHPFHLNFTSQDLNLLAAKLNEVIAYINK